MGSEGCGGGIETRFPVVSHTGLLGTCRVAGFAFVSESALLLLSPGRTCVYFVCFSVWRATLSSA